MCSFQSHMPCMHTFQHLDTCIPDVSSRMCVAPVPSSRYQGFSRLDCLSRCFSPSAMLCGSQALLEVVHQHRDSEGVWLGDAAGPRLGGEGPVLPGLLFMLQVLVCTLSKDAHHLTMHLTTTQHLHHCLSGSRNSTLSQPCAAVSM